MAADDVKYEEVHEEEEEYMEDGAEGMDDGEAGENELDAMRRKLAEMEEEAARLKEQQAKSAAEAGAAAAAGAAADPEFAAKQEADARSVYVGNVDYAATPEELQLHFQGCGTVNRVTILTDVFGNPKGFAYIEFLEPDAVDNALMTLDNTEIRGRNIKVMRKRTNVPGLKRGRGRGRGGRFAPRGRGYYGGYGYAPRGRGGYRGRGRSYSPY